MAIPGIELVQPGEKKAITLDYSSVADRPSSAVNVASGVWTLIDLSDQSDVTASKMGGTAATVVSNVVSGTVDGLTANRDYKLNLVITLTDAQELKDQILIKCREL